MPPVTGAKPRTLCEAFQSTVATHPDVVALHTPDDGVVITWRRYGERVRRIAAGLAKLGVRRGETVGIMLTNRPESTSSTSERSTRAQPPSLSTTRSPPSSSNTC